MMQRRQFLKSNATQLVAVSSIFLPASGLIFAQGSPGSAPRASQVLYLHGHALQANVVLTPQDLRAMPEAMQGSFTQTRDSASGQQKSTVRGVKLPALIERMGLSAAGRANWKTLLVTASATDDYRALFTWAELSNTPAGEGVLVLHERDGAPLSEREGLIALQASTDLRLGARHVRNLLRLEVNLV
jgi:hypothetical protein